MTTQRHDGTTASHLLMPPAVIRRPRHHDRLLDLAAASRAALALYAMRDEVAVRIAAAAFLARDRLEEDLAQRAKDRAVLLRAETFVRCFRVNRRLEQRL